MKWSKAWAAPGFSSPLKPSVKPFNVSNLDHLKYFKIIWSDSHIKYSVFLLLSFSQVWESFGSSKQMRHKALKFGPVETQCARKSCPYVSSTRWTSFQNLYLLNQSLSVLLSLNLSFSHSVSLCMIRWMESMEANLDRELGRAKCQTICLAKDFSIPDSDHLNLGNNSLCCWNTDFLSFM